MYALDLQVPALPEVLRDIEGIDDTVVDEMQLTMRRSVDVIEAAVVQRTPVGATSQTREGWGTDVQRGVDAVKGIVANPVPHAIFAEKGRPPGKMPPVDAIELWVKRKGLAGVFSIRTRRRLGGAAVQAKQDRALAWGIAKKIAREGTKGAHMAEEGLAAVRPQVEADFAAIPERIARRFETS